MFQVLRRGSEEPSTRLRGAMERQQDRPLDTLSKNNHNSGAIMYKTISMLVLLLMTTGCAEQYSSAKCEEMRSEVREPIDLLRWSSHCKEQFNAQRGSRSYRSGTITTTTTENGRTVRKTTRYQIREN